MPRSPRYLAGAALVALAACSDVSPIGPAEPSASTQAAGAAQFTVMTRNLYVGADVDAVIGALVSPDPSDGLPALQLAIGVLQHTDFPTRARAIAGELASQHPAVVGLQEVYQLGVDLTAIGLPVNINLDFLA